MTMLIPLAGTGAGAALPSPPLTPTSSSNSLEEEDDGRLSPNLHRPAIIDLQSRADFAFGHQSRSYHVPLSSLHGNDMGSYDDAPLLATQWVELRTLFKSDRHVEHRCPSLSDAAAPACRAS
ncbi:hypothetical protein ACQY0O_005846 [Thecaphora frezii]